MSPIQSIQGVNPSAAASRVSSRPQPRGEARETVQNEQRPAPAAQTGATKAAAGLGGQLDITA